MKTRFASENTALQFLQSMQLARRNLTCVNGMNFHVNLLSPLWRNMWVIGNSATIRVDGVSTVIAGTAE